MIKRGYPASMSMVVSVWVSERLMALLKVDCMRAKSNPKMASCK